MKRIFICMISLIMCCSFIIPSYSETFEVPFIINTLTFANARSYLKTTGAESIIQIQQPMTKVSSNLYRWTGDILLSQESVQSRDWVFGFNMVGYIDKISSITPDQYISFNVKLNFSESKPLDFSDLDNEYVRFVLPGGNSIRNYVITKLDNYSYQFSFIADLKYLNYDFYNATQLYFYIPSKWVYSASYRDDDLTVELGFDQLSLTFDTIPITAGDVDIIINDLDSIDTTLNAIKGQLDTLPGDVAAQIKDIELGQDYNKNLDTSEIVAYESALDRVMEEVDVDQVIDIMGDGVSLNQPGMYNDQSFNSVSDLMTSIIDATGIMPLITLTLSIGLACFIIGRSGKL